MATIEELVLQIAAENSELKATLADSMKATKNATEQMSLAVKQFSDKGNKDVGFFQQAMATMAGFVGGQAVIGAFNMAKDAVLGFANIILTEGIDAANAQEKAVTQLSATLAASGRYSTAAVDGFEKFANTMESTKNISDDLVLSQAAVLAGMTRLSNDGIQKAITSAADLSAALGIGLEQAVQMVGKAANGQTDSFKKLGIEISETGGKAAVFDRTLQTLNSRFGGSAAKQAETFAGSVTNLKNSFGNFVESIGASITSNQVVIKVISELANAFKELEDMVNKNKASIKEFIDGAVIFAVDATQIFVATLDALVKSAYVTYNALKLVGQGIVDAFVALKNLSMGGSVKDAFKDTGKAWDDFKASLDSSNPVLEEITAKLGRIGMSARETAAETDEGVGKKMPAAFKNAAAAAKELDSVQKAMQESQNSFTKDLATNFANFQSGYENATAFLQTQLDAQLLTHEQYYEQLTKLQQDNFAAQRQATVDSYMQGGVDAAEFRASQYALDQQQALAQIQLENEKREKIKAANQKRTDDLKSTFGVIATLASSSSQELAAIGKAAAIAQATIDGIAAVQKALASAPPPFNFALAALVGAATAANVAKIGGVQLAGGIDSVPRSSSGGNLGDNFPAILQPGERVVPAKTNEDLTAFLQQETSPREVTINIRIENTLPASREAGEILIDTINDAISRGALPILGTRT